MPTVEKLKLIRCFETLALTTKVQNIIIEERSDKEGENMKARWISVCIMNTVLLSLLACSSGASKELSVDITNSGKEVALAAGGTLTITLESNITTGYSWNETANISDKLVLQQTGHKYETPATPALGAGGKEVWTIKALKAGKSTISMEYRRPFEPTAAPANTFTLIVVVQ